MDLAGTFHGLQGDFREFVAAGGSIEVRGPFEFGRRFAVSGFVEEPTADLVSYEGFPGPGVREAEGFFMQPGCFVPLVLPLMCVGKNEQGPEAVWRGGQQAAAGCYSFLTAVQQRENPHPFQCRELMESVFHRASVQEDIAQHGGISTPDLSIADH